MKSVSTNTYDLNLKNSGKGDYYHYSYWCQDSSVGIATRYGLDGPGIESQWGEVARFSAPVQTCPVSHPASCTMGTGSLPG